MAPPAQLSMTQEYDKYRARFPGPVSFPNPGGGFGIKNNGIAHVDMGMPAKFNPSADDSLFSQGRQEFNENVYNNYNRSLLSRQQSGPINRTGIVLNKNTAEDIIRMRKIRALGSSTKVGQDNKLAYKNFNRNTSSAAAKRCRSGGCIAPAKKGANTNFKSGGS